MNIKGSKKGNCHMLLIILVVGALALGGVRYAISQSHRAAEVMTIDPLVLAARSVLTAIDRAGERLVAVGERGIVLLSEDNGENWQLVESGVAHTLTAVSFKDGRLGLAVGHQGVLLRTTSGGETWQRVALEESSEGGPHYMSTFLNIRWTHEGDALVVGAFGEVWLSEDGGLSWKSLKKRLPNDAEYHLYDAAELDGSIYLSGELGTVLAIGPDYADGRVINTPYSGTFFGVLATEDKRLLLYGLRGTALVSADEGRTWEECLVPTEASLTVGLDTQRGLLLASANGEIFHASRGNCEFLRLDSNFAGPISGLVQQSASSVIVVGARGVSNPLAWD